MNYVGSEELGEKRPLFFYKRRKKKRLGVSSPLRRELGNPLSNETANSPVLIRETSVT